MQTSITGTQLARAEERIRNGIDEVMAGLRVLFPVTPADRERERVDVPELKPDDTVVGDMPEVELDLVLSLLAVARRVRSAQVLMTRADNEARWQANLALQLLDGLGKLAWALVWGRLKPQGLGKSVTLKRSLEPERFVIVDLKPRPASFPFPFSMPPSEE